MAIGLKTLSQIIADCAKVISRVETVEATLEDDVVMKTDFGDNFDTQKPILMGFSVSDRKLYYKPTEDGTATRLANYSELSDFRTESQIKSIITGYGYITSAALSGLATESYVTSQGFITSAALSDYVKTSALSGYAKTTDLTDFVTATQVGGIIDDYGFLTSSDLNGYATESFVTGKGYLVASDISGFKTESQIKSLIEGYSYITASALSGYAKTTDLNLKELAHEDKPTNWATLKLLTVNSGVLYYNGTAISNPDTGSDFENEAILASIFSSTAGGTANGTALYHKKSDGTYAQLAYISDLSKYKGMAEEEVPSNWATLKKLTVSGSILYYDGTVISGNVESGTVFENESVLAKIFSSGTGTATNGTELWHKKSDDTYARLVYASEISGFKSESQIKSIIESYSYLTSSSISGFKTEAQIKSIVESYNYLTSSSISGFKTESQIKSIIESYNYLTSTDVSDFVTESDVETLLGTKGYLTSSSISGFKTEAQIKGIVESYNYITSSALTGYLTSSDISDFITESDVETLLGTKGYLTSSSLSGYATESFVTGKGYLTASSLEGYVQSSSLKSMAYIDVPANFSATNWGTVYSNSHTHASGVLADIAKPSWFDSMTAAVISNSHTHASGVLADVAKPSWWDTASTNLAKAHTHASGVLADVTKPTNWDTIFGQQYFLTAAAGAMAYLSKPAWWDSMTATVISNSHTHTSGVLADVSKPTWFDSMSSDVINNSHTHSKTEVELSSLSGTSAVVAEGLTDALNYRYDVYLTSSTKTIPNPMVNIAASANDAPIYVPASSLLYLDTNNTRLCIKVPLEWLDVVGDTSTSYTIKVRRYKL